MGCAPPGTRRCYLSRFFSRARTFMSDQVPTVQNKDGRFTRTLIRVLAIQAVALIVLWILQARYDI